MQRPFKSSRPGSPPSTPASYCFEDVNSAVCGLASMLEAKITSKYNLSSQVVQIYDCLIKHLKCLYSPSNYRFLDSSYKSRYEVCSRSIFCYTILT